MRSSGSTPGRLIVRIPYPEIANLAGAHFIPPGSIRPAIRDKKRLNIMCFDGGGLRGVMGTIILERLLLEFPDLMSKVDFFAGCSNGAMIAMSLAFGHTPSSCRTLLEVTGEIIFTKGGLASGYNSAKFANHYLKLVCDESWVCRLVSFSRGR